jgi:hypothetical protein
MGESNRRKQVLGDDYGKSEPLFSWLPFLTKYKSAQFVQITTTGAWVGIGLMVTYWITIRFIGPALGWWELKG